MATIKIIMHIVLCRVRVTTTNPMPQEWRPRASEQLQLWKKDFDKIHCQIPDDERHQFVTWSLYWLMKVCFLRC